MQIPLSRPDLTEREALAAAEVVRSGQLSLGPKVEQFEQSVASFCGIRHAVAVNSGTSGLHLCLRAVGFGRDDEMITTPFSFIATANCAMFDGGRPVFVDIDPDTWNIDPAGIEAAVTPRTRVLMPVHVFGQVCRMAPILEIAERRGLTVIEDSCEALGARWRGRAAGTLGRAGCFGFYPNKQVCVGEGGMIVTDDDDLAALCRSMRNQGRGVSLAWLDHERLGYNYRLSDVACAIGAVQMSRIEELLARRTAVAQMYVDRLGGDERLVLQQIDPEVEMSWFVFVVRLADRYTAADRDRIIAALSAAGIGCKNYFAPLHLQTHLAEAFGYKRGDFPVCEALSDRSIALPFYGQLTEAEVDAVCTELRRLL